MGYPLPRPDMAGGRGTYLGWGSYLGVPLPPSWPGWGVPTSARGISTLGYPLPPSWPVQWEGLPTFGGRYLGYPLLCPDLAKRVGTFGYPLPSWWTDWKHNLPSRTTYAVGDYCCQSYLTNLSYLWHLQKFLYTTRIIKLLVVLEKSFHGILA